MARLPRRAVCLRGVGQRDNRSGFLPLFRQCHCSHHRQCSSLDGEVQVDGSVSSSSPPPPTRQGILPHGGVCPALEIPASSGAFARALAGRTSRWAPPVRLGPPLRLLAGSLTSGCRRGLARYSHEAQLPSPPRSTARCGSWGLFLTERLHAPPSARVVSRIPLKAHRAPAPCKAGLVARAHIPSTSQGAPQVPARPRRARLRQPLARGSL
eukprot:scaffold2063_cov401-Prasinococcus_capsulatus_cf.AAC.16